MRGKAVKTTVSNKEASCPPDRVNRLYIMGNVIADFLNVIRLGFRESHGSLLKKHQPRRGEMRSPGAVAVPLRTKRRELG